MLFLSIYQDYHILPLQGWNSHLFLLVEEVCNFFKLPCPFNMEVHDNMEWIIYSYVLCWNTEMTELCLTKGHVCQLLKKYAIIFFFFDVASSNMGCKIYSIHDEEAIRFIQFIALLFYCFPLWNESMSDN